jgi:hypothetical protein
MNICSCCDTLRQQLTLQSNSSLCQGTVNYKKQHLQIKHLLLSIEYSQTSQSPKLMNTNDDDLRSYTVTKCSYYQWTCQVFSHSKELDTQKTIPALFAMLSIMLDFVNHKSENVNMTISICTH